MYEVNEQSSAFLTVSFLDENESPVTPDTANYRIDDKKSKREILPVTSMSPLSTSVILEITPQQNRILNEINCSEVRRVTVKFTYASTKQGTLEFLYKIINLVGVTTSQPQSPSPSPSASASPS